MFAGAFFDVLDGMVARAMGGGNAFGKQLDSLADMVTFGVAPGMILWISHLSRAWSKYLGHVDQGGPYAELQPSALVAISAIVLCIASAWRLAKFNVDSKQANGFLGLPTPANGLFWSSMTLAAMGKALHGGPGTDFLQQHVQRILGDPSVLFGGAIALALFMLSSIPLPSLKFKHMQWKGNEVIYLLLGIGLLLVVLYGILAVPLILLLYLFSPLWGKLFPKQPI